MNVNSTLSRVLTGFATLALAAIAAATPTFAGTGK
jgi:hypothetical protein